MEFCFDSVAGVAAITGHFEIQNISGSRGAAFPIIRFPLCLHLMYPYEGAGFAFSFRDLRARVGLRPERMGPWVSVPINLRTTSEHRDLPKQTVYLEFIVSRAWIEEVETMRNGAGVRFRFEFELFAEGLVEAGREETGLRYPLWNLKNLHRLTGHTELEIPREQWCQRVLAPVGYGEVHLIELPVIPVETCAFVEPASKRYGRHSRFKSRVSTMMLLGNAESRSNRFLRRSRSTTARGS